MRQAVEIRSQTILVIASIGTERIAPGAPHIQNQKTSEMMTRTGLRMNRRARSIGIKNHQLSWWFDGEPLKAVSKDSATFGMGLWDH